MTEEELANIENLRRLRYDTGELKCSTMTPDSYNGGVDDT
jgi:hypothetical protein